MKKFSLLTLAILLSGCAANVQTNSTQQGPKESAGAISGMIIGGALANDMAGDSRNKSLATVLGAFVGGVIGQNIGAQLDERDRFQQDLPERRRSGCGHDDLPDVHSGRSRCPGG